MFYIYTNDANQRM